MRVFPDSECGSRRCKMMAECRKCGAITTDGVELAWSPHDITCPEFGTSMRLTEDEVKALR